MVNFSPILHVFEESGTDFFDKEALRDLRKVSEVGTCHESWSSQDRILMTSTVCLRER